MHKPLWYDVMVAHPPPIQLKGERPMRLQWELDDNLRRTYLRRNPAATLKPKALFLDPNTPEAAHEHEADTFVRHQKQYMRRGATEEEAYDLALQQQKEKAELTKRARDAEVERAARQAAAVGATQGDEATPSHVPSAVAQSLLRRFAEEAREAGQPYPKHWFADGGYGEWRGISSTQVQLDLVESTRKALKRTEADMGTVSAILGAEIDLERGNL